MTVLGLVPPEASLRPAPAAASGASRAHLCPSPGPRALAPARPGHLPRAPPASLAECAPRQSNRAAKAKSAGPRAPLRLLFAPADKRPRPFLLLPLPLPFCRVRRPPPFGSQPEPDSLGMRGAITPSGGGGGGGGVGPAGAERTGRRWRRIGGSGTERRRRCQGPAACLGRRVPGRAASAPTTAQRGSAVKSLYHYEGRRGCSHFGASQEWGWELQGIVAPEHLRRQRGVRPVPGAGTGEQAMETATTSTWAESGGGDEEMALVVAASPPAGSRAQNSSRTTR